MLSGCLSSLVDTISQGHLEGISSTLVQMFTWTHGLADSNSGGQRS